MLTWLTLSLLFVKDCQFHSTTNIHFVINFCVPSQNIKSNIEKQ